MNVRLTLVCTIAAIFFLFSCKNDNDDAPRRLEILFLGHASQHHESTKPAELLSKEIFNSGINVTYTEDTGDLDKDVLEKYDALVVYANYDSISDAQADALLGFVKSGKGFIPIHCASHCFRNNAEVVELIGGQFKSHETDSFPSVFVKPDHEILKGLNNFTTFDETYVHDKISKDITVLTERVQGDHHEPYTWVKEYGNGRVFYTAYGHDERTWNNPGFLALLKNGIMWAAGDDAVARLKKLSVPQPQYSDARIPNYEKRDPAPKFQAPLSPEQSMALTQIPPGFELQLFASEPNIRKPISMNWDHRGRLWVIETVDYPNTVRDNKESGDDRIKILEDTDGDGKADKFTVFADKLNIPTSIVFANDGVIISQAPYFLHLRDTNGDDKADKRDTIMRGWGTFDTHAGPSNLRYGFDNKIWGTVGYAGYQGVDDKGDSIKISQGVFTINPDGKQFNFLSRTSNNTWGLGFSEENDVFISTANNTHSAFFAMPQSYLKMVPEMSVDGIEKIEGHYGMHVVTKNLRQVDVHGGFTAAAGHSLYTARNFPKEYWNRIAFVNEPTGRVIHNAVLERNGSSFREKDGWNLMASSDDWWGPVQAEVGPDGAVWILDWYNFIIQHNPTPEGWENGKGNAYINPMRDTTRGRIYRLKYKGANNDKILSLDKSKPGELVKALSNNNMFWRLTAQRLLVEKKDKTIAPSLEELVKNSKPDEIGMNAPAIHALYTLHGLNALDEKVAVEALKNSSAGVRKAAISVLPNNANTASALISSGIFNDPDLRVRLAAILKSIDLPADKALNDVIAEATKKQDNINDKWISKALYIASYKNGSGGNTLASGSFSESIKLGEPEKVIIMKPIQNVMKFEKEKINVRAGSVVEIVFDNIDFMQHNLLILQQGSLDKVGAAADKLAMDPEGATMNYVPKIPEVLYATPLVNPDSKYTLKFRVPEKKGDYPYICSFPGHWRIMKGVMEVR
jgi:uncharacterized protein